MTGSIFAFGCAVASGRGQTVPSALAALPFRRFRPAGYALPEALSTGITRRKAPRTTHSQRSAGQHRASVRTAQRKLSAVFNDGDEQVLRADIVAAELGGRELCHLQNALCARGEIMRW